MKYDKYILEDFLADKNFINWVNNPSDEAEKYWQGVMQTYPEKREVIEKAVELLKSIHFGKLTISDQEKDRILRNTIALQYSDRSKYSKGSGKKPGRVKVMQIAAIIILFTSAATFLTFQFSELRNMSLASSQDSVEMLTKQNPAGRKSRFYLPDGSYVTLNSDSRIDYYSNFTDKREVWLTGEASFQVKENLGNNFLVHTENLDIIVKGTTFNVTAFPSDLNESISLLTGKVNVSSRYDSLEQAYNLVPGEKLSVDLQSNRSTISDLDMDEVLWSSGILVFNNDDIDSFTKKIHRWYGVSTEVSGATEVKINIDGKFDNESLINVLESLKFTTGIDYNFDDNIVKLQF